MNREVAMKRTCAFVSVFVLLSLLMLLLGGAASRIGIKLAASVLAAVLPGLIWYFLCKRDEGDSPLPSLAVRKSILPFLPLLPVFLVGVLLLAYLSAILAKWMGLDRTVELTGSLPSVILTSAVMPALTEELLCRFLCLRPLARYGKAPAVLVSALLFSFMHLNMAQIPYAFCAGIFLGALALASGSVWLPILFHFANNLLSVLLWYFGNGSAASDRILHVAAALAVLGLAAYLYLALVKKNAVARQMPQLLFPRTGAEWKAVRDMLLSPILAPLLFFLLFSII
jgi:membrane protease YdiL (CAAX protease family)